MPSAASCSIQLSAKVRDGTSSKTPVAGGGAYATTRKGYHSGSSLEKAANRSTKITVRAGDDDSIQFHQVLLAIPGSE
jgi:hypothetical protein